MKSEFVKIVIVDDHQIVIDGLRSLLEDVAGFTIIATTTHAADVEEILANNPVDVVLTELAKVSVIKKTNEDSQLTIREMEIIRLIEKELSNKEISEHLFISERTVETHRKNIFRKTKTSGVIGLIKYAYEHKLINSI